MQIRLDRMTLENFKCHKYLNIEFGGRNADIRGDNAAGKSSIYDAITWLLFDKDSHGSSKFDIKPLGKDGEVLDHEAITSVECHFLTGAEPITFRKTLRENWTTRRGSRELVYTGNSMEYFVNGVPARKGEYDQRVQELCDEDTFRLLTSVSWFPDGMTWQKRRATLMGAFGTISDREIMEANDELHPLLAPTENMELENCKKVWTSRIKTLKGIKTDIPARLDELIRQVNALNAVDYESAEVALNDARARIAAANVELLAVNSDAKLQQLENELKDQRGRQQLLTQENELYRRSQMANQPNTVLLQKNVASCNAAVARLKQSIASADASIVICRNAIESSRQMWAAANAEEFRDTTCPTCGQPMPPDKIAEARRRFEIQKQNGLRRIEENAARDKARIAEIESVKVKANADLESVNADLTQAEKELQDALNAKAPEVKDMDGYAVNLTLIQSAITDLEDRIFRIRSDSATHTAQVRAEKDAAIADEKAALGTLAKKSLMEDSLKRIDELREEARTAAAELESLENLMMLTEDFTRIKAKMLEDGINGHFHLAQFRLFRPQANGGIEDRCDVTYNGVPYGSLNSGMRINVGIDIINTLGAIYGITVPLFIDNAESVTTLEPCLSQTIRLTVDEKYKEVFVNG